MPKKTRLSDFVYKIIRWLNILTIFATFGAYLAPYISPQTTWLFAILGLFYPVFLFSNTLFLIFWLWRKKKYWIYSLGCILLGSTHLFNLISFHLNKPLPENPLTVVTYNTHSFSKLFSPKIENHKENQIQFKEELEKKLGKIEIFCTQEFGNKEYISRFKTLMNLPHSVKHSKRGVSIFSKYKIIKSGEIGFENTGNSCVWADLNIEGKTIRIYSLHLQSTKISGEAAKLRKEGNLKEKETWRGIKGILEKYHHSTELRVAQTEKVSHHISESPHPVILCGDFNDTPISYVYRKISKGLCDNFKEAARDWGATYNGGIPMLRIDYILTSENKFDLLKHGIIREKYSDHYPVYSQLTLTEKD